MEVRAEKPEDVDAVREVLVAAFARSQEADLVDRLRGLASTLSLVAIESQQIVGHIFFSPVQIQGTCKPHNLMLGLAPLAVLPEFQRQGIGSYLIRHGLEQCAVMGCQAIVVLGHPAYYPRFGFRPAKTKNLRCEFPVPDEVFMVLEIELGSLDGCQGTVQYQPEFKDFE